MLNTINVSKQVNLKENTTFAFRMNFESRTAAIVLLILMTSTWARGNVSPCDTVCVSDFYKCFNACVGETLCEQCVEYQKVCLQNCHATNQSNGSRKRREVYVAPAKITDVQGLKRYLNLQ